MIKGRLPDLARHYLAYAFWGAMTTAVNVVAFFVLRSWFSVPLMPSNLVAWALAVLFAFATNRAFVFASRSRGLAAVSAELARFFASRLFSGALDMALMWLFADAFAFPEVPVKVAVNLVVIAVNYVTSLVFVFDKGVKQ